MKPIGILIVILVLVVVPTIGCDRGDNEGDENGDSYNPVIDPANFVADIDNTYLPMTPGTTYIYKSESDGETEDITVVITHDTKVILGVTCIVVRDTATSDGEVTEDTFDWYAQDKDGNVWYFGEDTKSYEDGEVVSTEGSWEAGVDGAKPGIVMEGNPQVGDSYRQEYYKDHAEDMSEILALGVSVTVPYGSFQNCVKTKDWSPLEPDIVEHKTFCPEVGQVLAETVEGGSEREELLSVTTE